MNIAILGTGIAGQTIATKLVSLGHRIMLGSRTADNPKALSWVDQAGELASTGTFAEAAAFGEVIFNCTQGGASIAALEAAGEENLAGKVIIDVANPLDFSKGLPPFLSICNTDSLGEQIQKRFPASRVVKTLNTVNCTIMVDPALLPGSHDLFLSGNDPIAKEDVRNWLKTWFGWESVIDLGDITTSRGTEQLL
ncbi:MAG: NAD(P)-binding domain-containing protein, partial [Bacteroidota bacterium]